MIKKIITFLKQNIKSVELVSDVPEGYKICEFCEGTGHEDFFTKCKQCNGEGYLRKTYEEYIDSLPPIKTDGN